MSLLMNTIFDILPQADVVVRAELDSMEIDEKDEDLDGWLGVWK